MAWQGQTIIEKVGKHYDAALMWLSASCLVGSVAWVIIGWSTTESVGTFNERLTAMGTKISDRAKPPTGSYHSVLDKVEGYKMASEGSERMIFARYIEPETTVPAPDVDVVITEPVAPDAPSRPRFVLTKTIRESVPLIWSGEMRSEKGLVLYQMNTPTGTHFLREDGEVEGYKILAFEDGKLKVQKVVDHEVFYLEYKKQTPRKELFAEIVDSVNEETQTVHVGSSIGEFTVVEITDTLARLKDKSQDQTLVLELQKPEPKKAPSEEAPR